MQGIKRDTDYAVRVVFHLAALGSGANVQVKDIAERRLMPAPFVRRVVARLAAAGILRTVRGSGGGVRLARPASAISLLDVVSAMEGGIVLNRCVSDPGDCPFSGNCAIHLAWADATRRVEERLGALAFSDLLEPPMEKGKET
ncbi:MAG: Rrf2 family transcriptional regulator [Thermodesulfobacteriota bacterium]